MWWWTWLACRGPSPVAAPRTLVLNEVLARNVAAWTDPDSGECPEHDDAIELWNAGDGPVSLGDFRLADGDGTEAPLPDRTVPAGGRVLLVADDGDGGLHLPFQVSSLGETLRLLRGDDEVDSVDVPPAKPDVSWGRWGDGGPWRASIPTLGAPNEAPPDDPCFAPRDPRAFDDHTLPCLASREGFSAVSASRAGTEVTKFEILGFPDGDLDVAFLDSRFYDLHDEWYLFRMLNGQGVRGEEKYRPYPGSFPDVQAMYAWAQEQDLAARFPEDFVRFTSTGRLTSNRFYELALDRPRRIGAGTLIRFAHDRAGRERWVFELEHGDLIRHDELAAYFETLRAHLGADLFDGLGWLVRSIDQEQLAQEMEDQGLAWADRVVRYDELTEPGAIEVYRSGTVAGKVRIVRAGSDALLEAQPTDVLVLEEIPDELPPCAALITSVPQTPLSHVALLAESRQIPNLSVVGLSEDARWDSWARVHRPVALRATAPDGLVVEELSDDQWATWQLLQEPVVGDLPAVDGAGAPWVVDLATVPLEDTAEIRRTFGGKSAGYLALLHTPGVITPEPVLGISIRAYQEHLRPLADEIDDVLRDPAFAVPGDDTARYLVLEGRAAFDDRLPTAGAARDTFLEQHPPGTTVGDLARADGLRGLVARTPLPPAVERHVLQPVAAANAALAPAQGLRFRSSSNVEDVEGFVGAGLYTSNTGYVDPAEGPPLADALRATFASYWSAEAFEERQAAGLEHRNGAMGVTVHPNFPDEVERANGVLHLTRLPEGGTELVINAQLGALSVTNPPTDGCRVILPEVVVVTDGPVIERRQASTEAAEVLSDGDVLDLWTQVSPVLDTWIAVDNLGTDDARDRIVQTLDLEFRAVDDGWPAMADGTVWPGRTVVKQCRSLEPSPAGLPPEVEALPVPKDVLARAEVVTERTCDLPIGRVDAVLIETDPALVPDVGYAEIPFVGSLVVDGAALDWRDLAGVTGTGPDDLALALTPEAASATGVAEIRWGPRSDCDVQTWWASPVTWLDDLLGP